MALAALSFLPDEVKTVLTLLLTAVVLYFAFTFMHSKLFSTMGDTADAIGGTANTYAKTTQKAAGDAGHIVNKAGDAVKNTADVVLDPAHSKVVHNVGKGFKHVGSSVSQLFGGKKNHHHH